MPRLVTAANEIRRRSTFRNAVPWIVIVLMIAITVLPLLWILRTAVTPPQQIFSNPESISPPTVTTDNFQRVLGLMSTEEAIAASGTAARLDFLGALKNSFVVATVTTLGQVWFSAMAAYAFARLKFPLRDKIFYIFLGALLVPPIATLIPNFAFIHELGWLNTYQGIIAPRFLMTPFAVFFLRQFFLTIPAELEAAARIDGAGRIRTFMSIILPLSIGPLATLATLTYIIEWNDFLWPFIVGQQEGVRTLTVALGVFKTSTPQGAPDWGGLTAGSLLSALPILIVFLLFARRTIRALTYTGIK
jgi:multiple sugar transport system permease protein